MKCLYCKRPITSGILMLFIGQKGEHRIIGFCSEEHRQAYSLDDSHFSKHTLSLFKRIKSRQQVKKELEKASLNSKDDNERDLANVLMEDS